ncbi:11-beta-hydroxysteroid dehydrogenase-like 4A isoform X2 [Helianthus annuus]|uniref:11-beta-hydroxysteroid dehydrogenase-like 4A isoform X2 n=1 Tax=Helianthus annuus TaxID=4232 RepID=UPI001652D632|nr:11-beta-hydroxysteroid dehydrogenase-like 4A isoform X2 [Helianthus annuus]
MDLTHKFLNIVLPIASIFLFIFILPLLSVYRLLRFCIRSLFPENLAGKVVLITGASAGIGEHLAYEYAKHGARLALVARREKVLGVVAEKAKELGSPDAIVIKADVSKLEDCKRFVDETINHFGKLDCLINNAGIGKVGLFEDQQCINDQTSVMDINFWGSVNATHFALPYLRKSKGRILVIGSVAGWFNTPKASKAAQQSFFETLRLELAPDIGVSIMNLGLVDTYLATNEFIYKTNLDGTPLLSVEGCAKTVVNSMRRGDESLTEPQWMRTVFLWVMLLRELMNVILRVLAKKRKCELENQKSHSTGSLQQHSDFKHD